MTMFKEDIAGQKFGRLTALYRLHNTNTKGRTYWLCVCDCGNLKEVRRDGLLSGRSNSCGCYHKDMIKTKNTKHGKTHTKLYRVLDSIKARCYNENNKQYKNYGGRGIKVCDEWLNDFQTFYDWAMFNGYKETLSIDRINNDGNYEPSNCRWVDMKIQSRNKRSNRNYTINGKTHCLMDWCDICNINYSMVNKRIHRGWSINRALELEE